MAAALTLVSSAAAFLPPAGLAPLRSKILTPSARYMAAGVKCGASSLT
jgi:hypothetical protein